MASFVLMDRHVQEGTFLFTLCRKPEASPMTTWHLNSTLVYKTLSRILCFPFLVLFPRDQVRHDLSLPVPCVAEAPGARRASVSWNPSGMLGQRRAGQVAPS